MHDDLIARIDRIRRKQARITKHMHAQSAVLVKLNSMFRLLLLCLIPPSLRNADVRGLDWRG